MNCLSVIDLLLLGTPECAKVPLKRKFIFGNLEKESPEAEEIDVQQNETLNMLFTSLFQTKGLRLN